MLRYQYGGRSRECLAVQDLPKRRVLCEPVGDFLESQRLEAGDERIRRHAAGGLEISRGLLVQVMLLALEFRDELIENHPALVLAGQDTELASELRERDLGIDHDRLHRRHLP